MYVCMYVCSITDLVQSPVCIYSGVTTDVIAGQADDILVGRKTHYSFHIEYIPYRHPKRAKWQV